MWDWCTGDGSLSRGTTPCNRGHYVLQQGTHHVHRLGVVSIEKVREDGKRRIKGSGGAKVLTPAELLEYTHARGEEVEEHEHKAPEAESVAKGSGVEDEHQSLEPAMRCPRGCPWCSAPTDAASLSPEAAPFQPLTILASNQLASHRSVSFKFVQWSQMVMYLLYAFMPPSEMHAPLAHSLAIVYSCF